LPELLGLDEPDQLGRGGRTDGSSDGHLPLSSL
jgi:hypothetical protein